MQEKITTTQAKLQGIQDYLQNVLNAISNNEPFTQASKPVMKASDPPPPVVPAVVPVPTPAVNSVPAVLVTNTVPSTQPAAPTPAPAKKDFDDIDNDGIEDATPQEIGKYVKDAIDSITPPPLPTHKKGKPLRNGDSDRDGIEDATPQEMQKYLKDAFDDIISIFK